MKEQQVYLTKEIVEHLKVLADALYDLNKAAFNLLEVLKVSTE